MWMRVECCWFGWGHELAASGNKHMQTHSVVECEKVIKFKHHV